MVTRYEKGIAYVRPWEDPGGRVEQKLALSELMVESEKNFMENQYRDRRFVILAIIFLMAMFAKLFRKAGPHEAIIVYGFRGTRVVKGRGTVIFPMVENCRGLSLELMSFDVGPSRTCTPGRASRSPWKR